MIKRDYLLRTVEQLAAFLARVVGLARAGREGEAQREIAAALGTLGIDAEMAARLTPSSLAMMLGERSKIEAASALLALHAELLAPAQPARASLLSERAEQLRQLARQQA